MSAAFETDLCPEGDCPRLRFNFANGWTASMVISNWGARLAEWPTGHQGVASEGVNLGPNEANADEALAWLCMTAGSKPYRRMFR